MSIKLRTGALSLQHRAEVLALFTQLVAESFTILPVSSSQFRIAARFADSHALGVSTVLL